MNALRFLFTMGCGRAPKCPMGRAVMKGLSLPAQAGSLWCCGCSVGQVLVG